jgi:hypothetical protein
MSKEEHTVESDEEDEDYAPPAHDSENEDDAKDAKLEVSDEPIFSKLSSAQQKSVDDAFAELFGSSKSKDNVNSYADGSIKKAPKSKKAMKKRKNILSEIFGGSSIASKLMKTSSSVIKSDQLRKRKDPLPKLEKTEVKEVKMFAGQAVAVSRSVISSEKPDSGNDNIQQKTKGIDAVLSQIAGPQKITTVDKTSMDWDSFKDKSGMEEELRKKAEGKDAYLVKREFLQRVDLRKFEQEKAQRERERVQAASSGIKK